MIRGFLVALGLLDMGAPAGAEVVQAGDTGFTVETHLAIAAPPAKVWATLIKPALWWSAEHSYSGNAANLTLVPRAGGCWCENWDGGSVEHLRVVFVMPDQSMRLIGGLGPLQQLRVTGVLSIALKLAGGGTDATCRYQVGGAGLAPMASAVDGVIAAQWRSLKQVSGKRCNQISVQH